MIKLTLPMYLASLLPHAEQQPTTARRSIALEPGLWVDVAHQLETRFPALARHLMRDRAQIANGFVLVVNDEIERGGYSSLTLKGGDNLTIIAALAGG